MTTLITMTTNETPLNVQTAIRALGLGLSPITEDILLAFVIGWAASGLASIEPNADYAFDEALEPKASADGVMVAPGPVMTVWGSDGQGVRVRTDAVTPDGQVYARGTWIVIPRG